MRDDFVERKAAAEAVIRWITDACGEQVASLWAWECTPIPCGLPSDKQLDEGLRIATGELGIGEHLTRCYAEMNEQCASEHKRSDSGEGDT